jgi:hypothetical protein
MIVFVSDLFKQDYPGGAELTTDAILQDCPLPTVLVRSQQLNSSVISKYKDWYWIFGNFANISPANLIIISDNVDYSVIEYDYKYCKYRSSEKHENVEGACDCRLSQRGKAVSIFLSRASNVWFMSEGQRQFYCNFYSFLDKDETKVLSSVFDKKSLEYFNSVDTTQKEDIWLIQKSPSWIKGTEDAISYAIDNNLNYEVFEGLSYQEMLDKFSRSKGFITFPRGKDTCPRTAIEAKLLGCEIISNEFVQHRDEEWFIGDKNRAISYLKDRTKIFWRETLNNSNLNLPFIKDSSYKNKIKFKIIVPVYNSESWIGRCISSILKQDYDNFECIVTDDISTDDTYFAAIKAANGDKRFNIIKNKEKKYALKNIHDAINLANPETQDVVVILDGDDWLSTDYVLSNLARYYTEEKCWMTYGSFVEYPTGRVGAESSNYPSHIVDNNLYRQDTWRASHLKTFKYFLWNKIKTKDLMDEDGKFYEMTYDQAMMLPMLEMSGPRAKYVSEINYVYNVSNPNAVNKTRASKQHSLMLKIRSKSSYERLTDENFA